MRDLLQENLGIRLRKLGKQGQAQYGIDLFGQIPNDRTVWNTELKRLLRDQNSTGKYVGIQCKSRLEGTLTFNQIKEDHDKTENLKIEIVEFIVATSMRTDAALQEELFTRRSEIPKFTDILFWEDLNELMERYSSITSKFYPIPYHLEERLTALNIQNLFQEMPLEDAIPRGKTAVSDLVDWTIEKMRLSAYKSTVNDLVECLKIAITLVPKPSLKTTKKEDIFEIDEEEKRRRFLLLEVESIFRNALMKLLNKSFDDHAWKKGTVVLEGLNYSFEALRACEDEAIFSNWLDDLREFYKERLVVELDNLTRVSYDKELYLFVVEFSRTLTLPMQESLKIQEGTFTFEVGLEMVAPIIEEQIKNPRRFHTSEDDHAFPTRFSVMVEPLMRGISDCAKLFSDFPPEKVCPYTAEHLQDEMCSLLFMVLKRYRDLNSETDIDRSMLGSMLSNPGIIGAQNFSSNLEDLINYTERRRFDYIIRPIISAIKRDRKAFDEKTIVSLCNASLASYRIQRPLYGRIRDELRKFCVECIECVSGDLRTQMILYLARELISPPQKNDDDNAVYGFQLIGRLVQEVGEKPEFLSLFQDKMAAIEGIEAPSFLVDRRRGRQTLLEFVYEKNKEIVNWKPPKEGEEFKGFKVWHPEYVDWEIAGSKKVVELFERFQSSDT